MNIWIGTACVFTLLACPLEARAQPPPPERAPEPLPLPRAPELARRPVELAIRATTSLEPCAGNASTACTAPGPAFGAGVVPLYRPTPYFAFGAAFGYSHAAGTERGTRRARSTLELGMTGRVYLLEEGALDPYLETAVGWASERNELGVTERVAVGPFGRAGGGVDWFVTSGVKLGLHAGYSQLMLRRGAVSAGLGLSVLLGESL